MIEEQRAHRRRLMLLAVTALILGAAVAVFVGLVAVKPPPQNVGATQGSAAGTAEKQPPRKVTISISVTPFNATLTLGGKPVGNPYEVQREAGHGTLVAEARADGFVTRQFKIPLAEGGRWMLALERKAEPISAVPDTKKPKVVKPKVITKRRPKKTDDDEIFDPYGK
jgi:hypothetical protein